MILYTFWVWAHTWRFGKQNLYTIKYMNLKTTLRFISIKNIFISQQLIFCLKKSALEFVRQKYMLRITLSRYFPLYLHLYCKSFVSMACTWSCGSLLSSSQDTGGQAFIAYNCNDVFWQLLSLFLFRKGYLAVRPGCLRRTLYK